MTAYTTYGRAKEAWETFPDKFLERGNIPRDSAVGLAVWKLTDAEFAQLVAMCDPEDDEIMQINKDGFVINMGRAVGSQGTEYSWR